MQPEIRQYLLEIEKIPLLSRAEELAIAKRLRSRDSKIRIEARTLMIKHNLRLVVSIAKRFQNRGIELADLISEGNLGLSRAAEDFNWRLGYRFTTYATHWVRQFVYYVIKNHSRTVRRPAFLWELWHKIEKLEIKFARKLYREELVKLTGCKPKIIDAARSAGDNTWSLSLDLDNGDTVGDLVPDHRQPENTELLDIIKKHYKILTKQEKLVMHLRYSDGLTMQETGKAMGVVRERVRQVESSALFKLKLAIVKEMDDANNRRCDYQNQLNRRTSERAWARGELQLSPVASDVPA